MVSRSAASVLLLLLCATALSQTPDQAVTTAPKSFHDAVLNITYFYPGRFIPAAPQKPVEASPASPQCVQSELSASSMTPVSNSIFVLSTIDNTCPAILRGAIQLGPFIREQLLRQLKNYGDPVITQEPTHYTVDGHPATIVLASVQAPVVPGNNSIVMPKITYAAKACILGNIPPTKSRKKPEPGDETKHVLCFDFTTNHKDQLSLMFGFTLNFDDHGPQPLVPGSALR
jgi:hypothetical protein